MNLFGKLIDEASIEHIRYAKTGVRKTNCKIYSGKKAPYKKARNIEEAIIQLIKANYIIWDLEDMRRKKNISAKQILEINKKSNKYNNIRNNMINEINRLWK